jgi:hypothetical protein
MNVFQSFAVFCLASNLAFALINIFSWIYSNNLNNEGTSPSYFNWNFVLSILNTHFTYYLAISWGQTYNLIGTPFNYQWLYFHPGL